MIEWPVATPNNSLPPYNRMLVIIVECILCLSRLVKSYHKCLAKHWTSILELIEYHLKNTDEPARIHANKLLEEMSKVMGEVSYLNGEGGICDEKGIVVDCVGVCGVCFCVFWR